MAKKSKTSSCNSTVMKAPRKHVSLDHWIGKDQFIGDGVSTDPAILWEQPRAGQVRHPGEEQTNHPVI